MFLKYAFLLKRNPTNVKKHYNLSTFFMTATCHQKDADFYTLVLIKETKKYLMTKFS